MFTHKVVLPGIADVATLKAISVLAGEVEVPIRSTTRPDHIFGQTRVSWTTRRQLRLPPDAVGSLPPGTALLVSGTGLFRVRT